MKKNIYFNTTLVVVSFEKKEFDMPKRALGELQAHIIELLKKRKKAKVSEIHLALGKKIAYTTVMTVMNRLYEKQILLRKKDGRGYLYWLSSNYKSKFFSIIERIKKKIFSGRSIEMMSYLIENSDDITKEELEKIQKLLKEKMKQ